MNPEPGTQNLEPGTRNLEPGTWNPEPGTRNPEPENLTKFFTHFFLNSHFYPFLQKKAFLSFLKLYEYF